MGWGGERFTPIEKGIEQVLAILKVEGACTQL